MSQSLRRASDQKMLPDQPAASAHLFYNFFLNEIILYQIEV